MSKIFYFVLFSFAVASAYEIVQDEQGNAYFLVPAEKLHRQIRDTGINIAKGNPGTLITASQQGNIVNSNGHRLDGGAFVSKEFRPSGPTSVGGQLGYQGPSSSLNVGAQHTQRFGTDVRATGSANLWSSGPHSINAVGSYDRHFGGLGGTGHSNVFAGLEYKLKGLQ